MQQKKVMPRIEYQRIGDDAVITQVWPDGHRQQLTMPHGQALILVDWILASPEEHDAVQKPSAHPSPEEMAETVAKPDPRPSLDEVAKTGEACGCTRTPTLLRTVGRMNVLYDPSKLDKDTVYRHLAWLGIDGDKVTLEPASGLFEADWPVMAIADGDITRSRRP